MNKPHPFKTLLTNPSFLKLWASQLLSQVTIHMMNFFILTRIFASTRSNIAVAFVWVVGSLPALLFAPLSGAIVDSFSRRKMMLITNLLQAATIVSALFIRRGIFFWYLIVFLYWFFDQIYMPSQQASVPELVGKKLLTAANGIFLLTQQASILLGFGFGGVLLSVFKPTGMIILATVNLVLAAGAVYLLPKDKPRGGDVEKDVLRFWQDFLVGYRYLKNHHVILLPLAMIIMTQNFVAIMSTILPAYTHNVLHLRLNYAGLVLIVPGGLGALVTTYIISRFAQKWRKKAIIQAGILLGGIAHLALALLTWFPQQSLVFASIIAVSLGIAVAAIIVPSQTLLQEKTPKSLLGRIYSQLSLLMTIMTCIPLVIAAGIADVVGDATMIASLGLILLFGYWLAKRRGDYVLANGFRV